MDGQHSRDIEATVDTGASYTTLPARLLRELGVAPMGKRRFLLADGRRIEMEYGEGQGEHQRRTGDDPGGLWRGRCPPPPPAGGLHPGGPGLGGGSRGTAIGSNPPHHVRDQRRFLTVAIGGSRPPRCYLRPLRCTLQADCLGHAHLSGTGVACGRSAAGSCTHAELATRLVGAGAGAKLDRSAARRAGCDPIAPDRQRRRDRDRHTPPTEARRLAECHLIHSLTRIAPGVRRPADGTARCRAEDMACA